MLCPVFVWLGMQLLSRLEHQPSKNTDSTADWVRNPPDIAGYDSTGKLLICGGRCMQVGHRPEGTMDWKVRV